MDRGKKSKIQHSSDFFALGKNDNRKRESGGPSSTAAVASTSKKPRISTSTGKEAAPSTWEDAINTECENSVDLISAVLQATEKQDVDKIVSLVCSSLKSLSSAKTKNDPILVMSLLYLGKIRPAIFANENITNALISLLKTDPQHSVRHTPKHNNTIFVMAANLLARGHYDKKKWPEIFLKIYIDDAVNERLWIDLEECSFFTDHIVAAFGTRVPPQKSSQDNPQKDMMEDESSDSFISDTSRNTEELQANSRFFHIQETVEKLVTESIKDQLNRRQVSDFLTKNLLKFAATTCGLHEVRSLVVTRLELWIHNAKMVKPAQELLEYICYNTNPAAQTKDNEVLSQLLKMRLKTKPLINIYMNCLRDLINLQPTILHIMMKSVVQQELLILYNVRNPNNMGILATIFQAKPEEAATNLAEIFQEFLLLRDDCLKSLRIFLRELVKMLRFDIDMVCFCKALMSNRPEFVEQVELSEFRERCCFAIADLVCLSRFLCVSPQIRDAHNAINKSTHDQKSSIIYNFYSQMSQIQYKSLTWMLEEVPRFYKLNQNEYSQLINKIAILDIPENYAKGDQWPPEQERMLLMNLIAEVPLLQDSIWTIILIGVSKDISFSIHDTVDIIDQMVRRACLLKYTDYLPLEVTKLDIINFLFSMAEYHHPENIQLPSGYEPPKLAISQIYWKVWIILLILSAHNTESIGAFCYNQYPMLKMLMEMCITNQFSMLKPPDDELQLAVSEKSQIIQFEGYLAAATSKVVINEQNSLLISQVMLMDPLGKPRRPPKTILEQLHLLNVSHRLGHLLCRSRKPDLLLDIIQRQGTSQSMPWLSDLVQSSDGDFNHLPVQCLCEFLLSNSGHISPENTRDIELIAFLQKMLHSVDENDFQCSYEVLEYFLRRLSSTSRFGRQSAIQACRLLLKNLDDSKEMDDSDADAESDWLLKYLPAIPSFPFICDKIIAQLRAACQVENSPDLIMMYIQFIMTNTFNDPVTEMLDHVTCWSLLIVERSCVFASILPKSKTDPKYPRKFQTLEYLFIMFNNFIIKMKENNSELTLPEYPDLLVVTFSDGTQCHVHLTFIHALIILLCECEEVNRAMELLEYFFPADNYTFPQAFSVETGEKVQILPDWLKLKMIQSSIERMVEVALHDLTSEQLVLFIQGFGTPKTSMSKLLALLDSAVVQDTEAINEAILNRSFLAKIIEIQQLRGAKNGHIALKYLKSLENSEETFMETQTNEKIEILEKFDPTKVKPRPTTMVRKFSSSYHVSSLLGDVLKKDEDESMPLVAAFPTKSFSGMKLCETGRNTHRIMSELIFETHPFDIERFAHLNLNLKNLKQSKLAALIDCMAVMLKEDSDRLSVNKSGIIIDWLVQFDSELIRTNLDVQVSLLFGKSIQIYRPYFLSLLIHQANWSTIALALDKLLNQNNSMGIYDPSSVLDFIDAIIRSPKLWQGRDKSYSNHEQIEFVLTLDDEQIKAFIDYILREEEMLIAKCESKMNERVTLLLACVQASSLSLKAICKHLEMLNCEKRVKDRFLQRLYMKIPHLFLSPKYKSFVTDMEVMFDSLSSTGDKFGHTIITTIASLTTNRDFQSFSQDVELILRKFAACHPVLLLRELPLLASLVAGRSHMDLRVLRQEHHIAFLGQTIGIFELLRPQIFSDTYKIPLHKALTCYLQLVQNHGKDLYGFTVRVLDFLKSYANDNIVSAYQLINQHSELLIEIYLKNRSINSLQIILSSTLFVSKSMIFEPPPILNKNDFTKSPSERLVNMSKMTQEQLVSVLQDIENSTNKKPGPLEDILGNLTKLIFNSSSDVRNVSHALLLKLLKHNPGNSMINSTCFNSYQLCLKNDDVNIALSVLDNLTEIVLSLQEYASDILQCVFNLGITSKTNTFTQLKKCMNAIKIQNGC